MSQAQLPDTLFTLLRTIDDRIEKLERFATHTVYKNRPELVAFLDTNTAGQTITPTASPGTFANYGGIQILGPVPKRSDTGGGLKRRLRLVSVITVQGVAGTFTSVYTIRLASPLTAVTATASSTSPTALAIVYADSGWVEVDSSIGSGDAALITFERMLAYTGNSPSASAHYQTLVFQDYD